MIINFDIAGIYNIIVFVCYVCKQDLKSLVHGKFIC